MRHQPLVPAWQFSYDREIQGGSMIEDPIVLALEAEEARYDELAERIHLYYHLDATIDSDVKEFAELRRVLGKDREAA
ncbi:hypothetical protein C1I92_13140 [Jiangella anatolica]|uniref:Uncharacterized protein n=2 Tax=Jiangella anatolica TaxID=2670374 RepID=A0A2W2CBR9_9ACTN|nr:hypothetical protein C1I92_13140 [Jiangella anatolica]